MVAHSVRYVLRESGLASVYATGVDAWIIILARGSRMFAYGASALVLALFFSELGVSDERIGLFMTLTLAGDVGLGLLLTFVADHVGRRRTLLFGSLLMILSGTVFALCENYWLLLLAAVVGVISATGGDFGPFRAVEESMLSELTNPTTRADVLSWYVTTSALGSSIGTEVAGRVVEYLHSGVAADAGEGAGESTGETTSGWPLLRAYHTCYLAYACMGILNLVLSLLLSSRVELNSGNKPGLESNTSSDSSSDDIALAPRRPRVDHDEEDDDGKGEADELLSRASLSSTDEGPSSLPSSQTSTSSTADADAATASASPPRNTSRFSQISAQTRKIMYGLWVLLMVDSLADGMANMSLTAYYMDSKFHLDKDSLGDVLSASYFLAACSSVFAGPLSRYIGLVNTMVFTHVPSSAAVLLFPLPHNVPMTYALLLLRVGLNNLDQAPRAALIAAVVRPEERTAVMGITSMLRTLASTTGPSLTGLLAGHGRFWIAFVVSGALRLSYDLGLFVMFVNIRLYQHEPPPPSVSVPAIAHDGTDGDITATSTSNVLGHPDSFVLDEEESVQ